MSEQNSQTGRLGSRHEFQAFQEFSSNFLISSDLKCLVVRELMKQLVHSLSSDSNLVLFNFS